MGNNGDRFGIWFRTEGKFFLFSLELDMNIEKFQIGSNTFIQNNKM